jgi:hypothetical protein
MKQLTALVLSATITAIAFTSCSKDNSFQPASSAASEGATSTRTGSAAAAITYDRIDAIMKDLSTNSYSLNFDQAMPDYGITRTAYGADNYLVFADPQTLKCPDPILARYKRIPIWRRPIIIQPTCPDMSIDPSKLSQVRDLLIKANYNKYATLKEISTLNGGGLLGDQKFMSQYPNIKLDRIDEITKDLSTDKFLMLNAPGSYTGGFTRSFYGFADLNSIVFRPYGKSLKDIFRPTLKGCFDPIILNTIRQRLQSMDPATYKYLTVAPLAENKSIAILYSQN